MRGITVPGLAAMISVVMWSCGGREPIRLPQSDPIPIHAWWSIPDTSTSVERYKELAEAGFTTSMSPFPNAEAVQKALDAAQAAGVKIFILCPELGTAPDSTAGRFMNHPALAGYHITDEPNATLFPELAARVEKIRAVDPDHPCYINLFPNYATAEQLKTPTYQAYVDSFIAAIPVPLISFDHYPVTRDSIRSCYYENLEIISASARTAGKPFWAFAIPNAIPIENYPPPTPASLRFQMYSNLAYGAQGLQYFTYWVPNSFHQSLIDSTGARTEYYSMVRDLNAELQSVAGVFMGSTVVSVGHTGAEIPRGTKAFEPLPPFTSVETPNGGAVVSRLEKKGMTFLVVVNRDIQNPLELRVAVEAAARVGVVGKDGAAAPLPKDGFQGTVAPGSAAIFAAVK